MNFKPHDYQSYAIEYIENHPVSAVLLDMGLGKTVISLTAIADLLFDSFLAHRILVIEEMDPPKPPDLRCCCGNSSRAKSFFDGRCRHHHYQS